MSISTVEDPVEFNLPMISQAQINPAQEFTYPKALRSLMRQDPQVIMVGEIRDPETAAIAVQAGLTGHLVISTIHSGIAAGVFARLINMEIEPFLLASSIIGVLGIRLIRKNLHVLLAALPAGAGPAEAVPPKRSRTAQFPPRRRLQRMPPTPASSAAPRSPKCSCRRSLPRRRPAKIADAHLQQVAIQQGMQTIWQKGLRRALSGQTTLEEILRVVAAD